MTLHIDILTVGEAPRSNRRPAHPLKRRVLDGGVVVEAIDGNPVATGPCPLAFADRQANSPFHEQRTKSLQRPSVWVSAIGW